MKRSQHKPGDRATADSSHAAQADQLLHEVVGLTPPRLPRADGIAVGIFDGVGSDDVALVSIPALGLTRIAARTISPLNPAQIGQQLALAFEAGDPLKPIVLGVMLPALGATTASESETDSDTDDADILVDGERVVFTAEHEIELRCGDAAIVLSSDGRIQLRGTYITSHASATQRIIGGSVNIN